MNETRGQDKLQNTLQVLETVFNNTQVLIAYLDPQFNFIRVNKMYAQADERDPSFFPGKNHFSLYPNNENEKISKNAELWLQCLGMSTTVKQACLIK